MTNEPRYVLRNARHLAADYVRRTVREGDTVVDATMGNGYDTLILCELVGETGHVYAFDVQLEAILRTDERLKAACMRERATLLNAGHETMAQQVKKAPSAIMFNFGMAARCAARRNHKSGNLACRCRYGCAPDCSRWNRDAVHLSGARGGNARAQSAAFLGWQSARAHIQRAASLLFQCSARHASADSHSEE